MPTGSRPLDALKLLNEMRVRRRIVSVAPSPERAQEGKTKNLQDLVEQLNQIYGLKGEHWDRRLGEQTLVSDDERCIEQLKALVERRSDTDPISCALATRLASRLFNWPLDEATELEVARLQAAEETDAEEMVGEGNRDEGIDTGPSDGSDERHVDSPDVDDSPLSVKARTGRQKR